MWRLLLPFCLIAFGALADAKLSMPVRMHDGEIVKVNVHQYTNEHNQQEMMFQTANAAKVILGFGRDIDRNGTIETFYIYGDKGITRYQRDNAKESNVYRAFYLLQKHAKYGNMKYLEGLFLRTASLLTIGVDRLSAAQFQWSRDYMMVDELMMAFEKNKEALSKEQKIYVLNLMMEIGQKSLKKFEDEVFVNYPRWVVGETLLWISGLWVARYAEKAIAKGVSKVLPVVISRIGLTTTLEVLRAQATVALKALPLFMRSGGRLLLQGTKNIWGEKAYIFTSAAIQTGVEFYVNKDSMYVPGNWEKTARNLFNDPDFQENATIGVMDNALFAVGHGIAPTFGKRLILLGVIGGINSYSVGTMVNGEQDSKRIIFDVGWSAGIDSIMFIAEMKIKAHFAELALKHANPKMKIIGWALGAAAWSIISVSQVAGYYGYAHASEYVDGLKDHGGSEIQLIPIVEKPH